MSMNKIFLFKFVINLYLSFYFFAYSAHSQTFFISSPSFSLNEIDSISSTKYNHLISRQFSDVYTLVDVATISNSQNSGLITIKGLLDICSDLSFRVKNIKFENDSNYYWAGVLESWTVDNDCNCLEGRLVLQTIDDQLIAILAVGDEIYEITTIGEGKGLMMKLSVGSEYQNAMCLSGEPESDIEQQTLIKVRNPAPNCNIDCLILYNNDALNNEGSLENFTTRAEMAINEVNNSMQLSSIQQNEAFVRVAGIAYLDFESSPDVLLDLKKITETSQLHKDQIANLRSFYEADIVMIYGGQYPGWGAAHIGKDDLPIGITSSGAAAAARHLFSHEFGHIIGGNHQKTDDDEGFAFGWDFRSGIFPCIGRKRTTIMSFANSRIPYFSNPKVEFKGTSTGHLEDANMALHIENRACHLASFYEKIEEFSVTLSGNQFECPCQASNVYATVSGGTAGATYDFIWEESSDGFTWQTIASTDNHSYVNAFCSVNQVKFIRAVATSSDGNTATGYFTLTAMNPPPGQEFDCPLFLTDNTNNSIIIYPNPTFENQQVSIKFTSDIPGIYTVKILNSQLQCIQTLAENLEVIGSRTFETNSLKAGLNFIVFTSPTNQVTIQKILVL